MPAFLFIVLRRLTPLLGPVLQWCESEVTGGGQRQSPQGDKKTPPQDGANTLGPAKLIGGAPVASF